MFKPFRIFLTEGKHWPADYIKTAYNMVKQSELGKQDWYADDFISTDLKNIANEFEPLTHKNSNLGYFSPIIRMFIKYAGTDKAKYQEFIERKLDIIIQRLKVITNDTSLETPSFKESFKNKWSFEDFKKETDSIFNKLASDQDEKAKNAKHEDLGYKIILINSYEELNEQFGGKRTGYNGKSEWCHTNGESTYDSWTDYGTYNFFVIAKKNWKKINPPDPETLKNPYDEYGLSLMAILVEVATTKLLNCTLRWNHIISPDKPGTSVDKAFLGWGDLAEVTGMDVKAEVEKKLGSKRNNIENRLEKVNKSIEAKIKNLEDNGKTEIDSRFLNDGEKKYIIEFKSKTIKKIENLAFFECKSLDSIDLPAVTSIGDGAFAECKTLTKINFPTATSIDANAFNNCISLTNIDLHMAINIGANSFYYCTSLTGIDLPAATSIGNCAFSGCTSLTNIILPEATSIGQGAFYGCTALSSISLPAATNIGDSAFYGCIALTSIILPETTNIENEAFNSCKSLKDVYLSNKIKSIGDNAFKLCNKLVIHFPKDFDIKKLKIGRDAFAPSVKFILDDGIKENEESNSSKLDIKKIYKKVVEDA